MTLPRIQLKEIPDEGLSIERPLPAAWITEAFAQTEYKADDTVPGRARLRLDKHDRDVTLSGTAQATVVGQCVRCLDPVRLPLSVEFNLHLSPMPPAAKTKHHDEIELSEGELDADHYENDTIECDHWVREQLLLEAPAHPSCPNGCANPVEAPAVPVETGVDPRLAVLKNFSKS